MALFNDGPMNRVEELVLLDSSLLETATVEGIDVAARIAGAQDAMAAELVGFLMSNAAGGAGDRRALGVNDVVVNSELKRWHALAALESVYRDANGHQTNDRYLWKWREFGSLAAAAKEKCLVLGIGLASDPVARAGTPALSTVPGIGAGGAMWVAVAMVNAAGQEGAASDAAMVTLAADTQAQVRLNDAVPGNVRGWDVYAGLSAATLTRQNDAVLGATDWWTQPSELRSGSAPGAGQAATTYVTLRRTIQRG